MQGLVQNNSSKFQTIVYIHPIYYAISLGVRQGPYYNAGTD